MPEIIEVELYRRLAERALGRPVASVDALDAWYLKGGLTAAGLHGALAGRGFGAARRIGKLLLLDIDGGPTLGLRFGMTGRLAVDGVLAIAQLEYGGRGVAPAWERLVVRFADGGDLRVVDPRRLGGVALEPSEERLGVDAFALSPAGLDAVLGVSAAPLKARLMDQARLAGLGNLLTDEILYRAGLDPARPAGSLRPRERARLVDTVAAVLAELTARGGSHTGELQQSRRPGASCPRDGAPLARRTIGGRTTFSCPRHQR